MAGQGKLHAPRFLKATDLANWSGENSDEVLRDWWFDAAPGGPGTVNATLAASWSASFASTATVTRAASLAATWSTTLAATAIVTRSASMAATWSWSGSMIAGREVTFSGSASWSATFAASATVVHPAVLAASWSASLAASATVTRSAVLAASWSASLASSALVSHPATLTASWGASFAMDATVTPGVGAVEAVMGAVWGEPSLSLEATVTVLVVAGVRWTTGEWHLQGPGPRRRQRLTGLGAATMAPISQRALDERTELQRATGGLR